MSERLSGADFQVLADFAQAAMNFGTPFCRRAGEDHTNEHIAWCLACQVRRVLGTCWMRDERDIADREKSGKAWKAPRYPGASTLGSKRGVS